MTICQVASSEAFDLSISLVLMICNSCLVPIKVKDMLGLQALLVPLIHYTIRTKSEEGSRSMMLHHQNLATCFARHHVFFWELVGLGRLG